VMFCRELDAGCGGDFGSFHFPIAPMRYLRNVARSFNY